MISILHNLIDVVHLFYIYLARVIRKGIPAW
jgi:hypothetical protein